MIKKWRHGESSVGFSFRVHLSICQMAPTDRGGNINLKGFRVRQWLIINSYHRSYLHDTHRSDLEWDRGSIKRTDIRSRSLFFFFFFLFFYLRSTDKKSSRPIGKRLEKNCAFFCPLSFANVSSASFCICRDTRQRNFALLLRDKRMAHTWYRFF